MRFANYIKGYTGRNPFSDNQARNFSDERVNQEFCPVSAFWTLFNDQHEILVGTRGCGKTFLLKMMRYSMLKHLDDPQAKAIISNKEYFPLYVPMHLEFITPFNDDHIPEETRIRRFQFAFNCLMATALISELESMLDDYEDDVRRAVTNVKLTNSMNKLWFDDTKDVRDLKGLANKTQQLYYSKNLDSLSKDDIPSVFLRQICSPLIMAEACITELLELKKTPTWIVCVDEAEFLSESLQKCINTIFRSDSNRIALKIATLPYSHTTLDTLIKGITVSNGNDFNYRVVDLPYESSDYKNLTNKLCKHRLLTRFKDDIECNSVEDFLGTIGNDDQIDYYRKEVGDIDATRDTIEDKIIRSLPEKRRKNSTKYKDTRKPIYDKYAPVFYTREMYKLSLQGNRKPGWFAGANVLRKVSQGNPRIFIQLMNELFEYARKSELTPKAQHGVITAFAEEFCEFTKALEEQGPIIYKELNMVGEQLKDRVHGTNIKSCGSAFEFVYDNALCFERDKRWIEIAIAYSRIVVSDKTKKGFIEQDTRFQISNLYAVHYWLPIRNDEPLKIKRGESNTCIDKEKENNTYKVKKPSIDSQYHQISLFELTESDI